MQRLDPWPCPGDLTISIPSGLFDKDGVLKITFVNANRRPPLFRG